MSRLAMALKKLPSEVRSMTFRQARALFQYWNQFPPEHEAMRIMLQVYTTWEPEATSEQEVIDQHRRSLERRWAAGAMNPKQLMEAMGGASVALGANGVVQAPVLPGIGPFPGA